MKQQKIKSTPKQARNVPYKVPGGGDPFSREYDNCIVGAGISGSVIAERYASIYGQTSLIIEKRHHIGGNMFDYVDEDTGIRVRWVFLLCMTSTGQKIIVIVISNVAFRPVCSAPICSTRSTVRRNIASNFPSCHKCVH